MLLSPVATVKQTYIIRPPTSRLGQKPEHKNPSERIAQEQCIVCNDLHDSACTQGQD